MIERQQPVSSLVDEIEETTANQCGVQKQEEMSFISVKEDGMMQSAMMVEDMKKIKYFEDLNSAGHDHKLNENLVQLMQMGFSDFQQNLRLLKEVDNDLFLALQQLLG
jgi:hypothetical protein